MALAAQIREDPGAFELAMVEADLHVKCAGATVRLSTFEIGLPTLHVRTVIGYLMTSSGNVLPNLQLIEPRAGESFCQTGGLQANLDAVSESWRHNRANALCSPQ